MKLVVLFLSALLLAYPQASKQERGKEVVNQALQALGGDQFLAVKDRLETGRAYAFYREQLSGLAQARFYTRYDDQAPAGQLAQRERQSFGKEDDNLMLFLPDNAYQITYRGAKPIESQRFERYLQTARRNIFYILRMRLKEPGLALDHRSTTVWQNTPVEVVDITDAENNVVTVYFHRTTKLPVRQTFIRRDPRTKDRIEEESIFAKYRDVGGGVQWPFSIMSYRNREKIFEHYSDSVVINQDFPETLFSLPSGLKVLPRERDTSAN